jgi:hypothetical protein
MEEGMTWNEFNVQARKFAQSDVMHALFKAIVEAMPADQRSAVLQQALATAEARAKSWE